MAADLASGAPIGFQGIRKQFGPAVIIGNLDLDIRGGEFISLLGPSGSGKSTLLMMAAGFEQPTAGKVVVGGRDVTHVPPERRDIGMVFQNYALFPHMTVAENVGFALKQRHVDRSAIRARVKQALDLVQLSGLEGRFPQQLSGGQQQRVAIARAVIFNPPVLLMDEPLSALDKKLREGMQHEIKQLHDRLGITFVYVTHDQREALVMSDRVAVLDHGALQQVGTPAELYDEPENRFVASFVGEANFLNVADAGERGEGTRAVRLGDEVILAHGRGQWASGATCMIRPEKFRLVEDAEQAPGPHQNRVSGTVRRTTFMGDAIRYLVDVAGQTIVVTQPHRGRAPVLPDGALARIEWAVHDTRLV